MTREEAKVFGYGFVDNSDNVPGQHILLVHEVDEIIDRIYDDIESRACDNCKHYLKLSYKCNHLDNEQITTKYMHLMHTYNSFGCNKFERKTD